MRIKDLNRIFTDDAFQSVEMCGTQGLIYTEKAAFLLEFVERSKLFGLKDDEYNLNCYEYRCQEDGKLQFCTKSVFNSKECESSDVGGLFLLCELHWEETIRKNRTVKALVKEWNIYYEMLKSCKIVVKKETNKGIEYIFKEGNDVGNVLFCDNKVWCTRNGVDTLTLSRGNVYCDSVVYLLDSNSKKGYLDLLKESEKFEKKFFDEDENIKGYYDAFYKVCEKRYQETHNSPDMLHQKIAQLQQTVGQLYQMVAQLQQTVRQIDRKI